MSAVVVQEYDVAHAYCKVKGCTMDSFYEHLTESYNVGDHGHVIKNSLGDVYLESVETDGNPMLKVFPLIN